MIKKNVNRIECYQPQFVHELTKCYIQYWDVRKKDEQYPAVQVYFWEVNAQYFEMKCVPAILDSQSKGSLRLGIERNFNQEGGYDLPKPNYYL